MACCLHGGQRALREKLTYIRNCQNIYQFPALVERILWVSFQNTPIEIWPTEACSCNHCCSGKSISITYSECVFVALGVQHAMRVRHIVVYVLPGSTTFFHVWKTGRFREGGGEYWTLRVFRFSLQLLTEPFHVLKRNERDVIVNVYWSSCKLPVTLVRF